MGKLQARFLPLLPDITLWGMELGILSMRRGELARFLFKPTYAYGTLGCPPLIPPNSTVLFEIELLDFLDSAESDKFCALSAVSSGMQMSTLHRKSVGFVFWIIIISAGGPLAWVLPLRLLCGGSGGLPLPSTAPLHIGSCVWVTVLGQGQAVDLLWTPAV